MLYNSEEWRAVRDAKVLEWCCGDTSAASFILALNRIVETWDDLIDGDKPVAPESINAAFLSAIFTIPANEFFIANRKNLLPTMMLATNAWLDSNDFATSTDREERARAFVLRDIGIDIAIQVALLCGGYDHMRKVSLDMRRFFAHETFDEWERDHAA